MCELGSAGRSPQLREEGHGSALGAMPKLWCHSQTTTRAFPCTRGGIQGAGAQEMTAMETAQYKNGTLHGNGHEPAIAPAHI